MKRCQPASKPKTPRLQIDGIEPLLVPCKPGEFHRGHPRIPPCCGSVSTLRKGPSLDWPTRLRVAEDAARGLNYLHNDIVPACLHRDIKPANILLDANLNALVADFGLAKHISGDASHVETRMAGTFGFMAPECLLSGTATKAGDVFAFGGVLLVLITGRAMFVKQAKGNPKTLIQWIFDRTHLEDPGEYVDRSLGANFSSDEAAFLLALALGCVSRAELRPTMATVLRLLTELRGGKVPCRIGGGAAPPGGAGHRIWAGNIVRRKRQLLSAFRGQQNEELGIFYRALGRDAPADRFI
ncbi:Putative protein kinase superfamily protein [Klebsormidium nitens]|uniref:non-specific serine/threonine protein kinase n=1 Tax=Klebsormidium nitens TaxID=105231 RepID=A0A1Y1IB17_KLENI|nr:Putative protein kinase superfamily protein [Klebsormidium nitens]|eukprot:GAQ86619.1 Putative protein kinase superfamily protein [Klebsormidium nitens]